MRVRKISQISISGPGAVGAEGVAARDAGTGGGEAVGATYPHNFETVGAPPPPQLWTAKVVHFWFCLYK